MHDSDKKKYLDFSGLEYIVDSFTYSPFVDYSCSNDAKVGIYADDYLTKYNSGWFEDKTNLGIDVNRRPITSTLYELYDLQSDPHELHNVYGQPGYEKVTEKLHKTLVKYRKKLKVDEY